MVDCQPLPEAHQKRIAAIIAAKKSKSAAARIFGCTRQVIKTAAEGGKVHPWTADRVAKRIAELDAAGKVP